MSLLELLIALALGLFLLLGMINAFVAGKDSIQLQTALAQLQENGRLALDLLLADIRAADYIGCSTTTAAPTVLATAVTWTGVTGYERAGRLWTPPLPPDLQTALASRARNGSDVLNLQHGRLLATTAIAAPVAPGSRAVRLRSNPDCLTRGDRLLLASCLAAQLFEITNRPSCGRSATTLVYAASANTASAATAPSYTTAAELLQFFDKTWYVAATRRQYGSANTPVYALYRRVNGRAREMLAGVEYLQLLYGERLPDGAIRYVPANAAGLDMAAVVSVRVGLLLQSFAPVLKAPDRLAYPVLDQTIAAAGTPYTHNGDRSLRRVFQSSVALRNR